MLNVRPTIPHEMELAAVAGGIEAVEEKMTGIWI
jgi:hypothetical protein